MPETNYSDFICIDTTTTRAQSDLLCAVFLLIVVFIVIILIICGVSVAKVNAVVAMRPHIEMGVGQLES